MLLGNNYHRAEQKTDGPGCLPHVLRILDLRMAASTKLPGREAREAGQFHSQAGLDTTNGGHISKNDEAHLLVTHNCRLVFFCGGQLCVYLVCVVGLIYIYSIYIYIHTIYYLYIHIYIIYIYTCNGPTVLFFFMFRAQPSAASCALSCAALKKFQVLRTGLGSVAGKNKKSRRFARAMEGFGSERRGSEPAGSVRGRLLGLFGGSLVLGVPDFNVRT